MVATANSQIVSQIEDLKSSFKRMVGYIDTQATEQFTESGRFCKKAESLEGYFRDIVKKSSPGSKENSLAGQIVFALESACEHSGELGIARMQLNRLIIAINKLYEAKIEQVPEINLPLTMARIPNQLKEFEKGIAGLQTVSEAAEREAGKVAIRKPLRDLIQEIDMLSMIVAALQRRQLANFRSKAKQLLKHVQEPGL